MQLFTKKIRAKDVNYTSCQILTNNHKIPSHPEGKMKKQQSIWRKHTNRVHTRTCIGSYKQQYMQGMLTKICIIVMVITFKHELHEKLMKCMLQSKGNMLSIPNKKRKNTFLYTTMAPEHQIYHWFHKREEIQVALQSYLNSSQMLCTVHVKQNQRKQTCLENHCQKPQFPDQLRKAPRGIYKTKCNEGGVQMAMNRQ